MAFFNLGIKIFSYAFPVYVLYHIRQAQIASRPKEEHHDEPAPGGEHH